MIRKILKLNHLNYTDKKLIIPDFPRLIDCSGSSNVICFGNEPLQKYHINKSSTKILKQDFYHQKWLNHLNAVQ